MRRWWHLRTQPVPADDLNEPGLGQVRVPTRADYTGVDEYAYADPEAVDQWDERRWAEWR
ncbi:hypothetical protein GCM10009718_02570 [Isoptericola halotolerans]